MPEKIEKDPLISIVMPVFNSEKYLDAAIACVEAQTYPNWELILVDDCSTDSSPDICRKWAQKDTRIQLIEHKQNMGIGFARNDGMQVSRGDYIGFMDNDDLIHPQMYEVLAAAAKQENADIFMCGSMQLPENAEPPVAPVDVSTVEQEKLDAAKVYARMYDISQKDWSYLAVWNKLYRAELVKELKFVPSGCEDGEFNCTAIRLSGGIVKLNTVPLYFWVQRRNSTSHSCFTQRNLDVLKCYFRMSDEIFANTPESFHSVAVKTFKTILNTRYNARKTAYKQEAAECIREGFPSFYKRFLICKKISLRWKCLFSAFYYCPFLYTLFRAFCEKKSAISR